MSGETEVRKRSTVSDNISLKSNQSNNGSQVVMKRTVGLMGGMSLIVGVMIGSGIFISPKGVLEGGGSTGMSLIIWLLGGVLSLFGALSYAELGTMIPKSGGEYAYLLDSVHPVFAFLFSFVSTVMLKPSSAAIICLTCAEYVLVPLFNDGCGSPPRIAVMLLAMGVLLFLTALNCISASASSKVQIFFTAAKLLALAIIIIGGFVKLGQGYTQHLEKGFEGTNSNVGEIAIGFYSSMWAYDGWNNLNMVTEELKDPIKTLPRAIFLGIPLVTIVYLLTNISYFTVLSPEDVLESPAVAITWAQRVIPDFAFIIPIFVAMSTFGAANGSMYTAGRLIYVAAREKHTVKSLSMIHVTKFTPISALVFNGFISFLMVIPSNIGSLIDFFSFAGWMFYALVFVVFVYLRIKRPDAPRPYKCPIVFPIIAFFIAIFLVLAPIIQAPQIEFLYAFLFIVGGLIFYLPFVHFKKEIPGMEKFNTFVSMYFQSIPPDEIMLNDLFAQEELTETENRPQTDVSRKVVPVSDVVTATEALSTVP